MFRRKQRLNIPRFNRAAGSNTGWRGYQRKIQLHDKRRQVLRRIPRYILALVVLIFFTHGAFHLIEGRLSPSADQAVSLPAPIIAPPDHKTIQEILSAARFKNLETNTFDLSTQSGTYHVTTTLDPSLQQRIINSLDIRHANRIGIVAMDVETGRILAMVSHDRDDPLSNACLKADLPAASIFKIVTAAAAVEAGGLDYQSQMAFNGGKFTLYRNQLVEQKHRHTNYTTLKASFAESINPVFGKLGKNLLGKSLLEKYAHAYFFNRDIEFDIPVEPSFLEISDVPYNLAEIASGFNRTTTVSPLHAAMIVASIANGGKLMKPAIIDAAAKDQETVYRHRPEVYDRTVDPLTVGSLKKLMNATITSGTAQKQFAGISRDPVLSRLEMGGKTGSINNNQREIRYDWFAGYASNPDGTEKIAIGIVIAHEKFIGKRAATYFREAVSHYFQNRI